MILLRPKKTSTIVQVETSLHSGALNITYVSRPHDCSHTRHIIAPKRRLFDYEIEVLAIILRRSLLTVVSDCLNARQGVTR